jgi:hypothetical protein
VGENHRAERGVEFRAVVSGEEVVEERRTDSRRIT